MSNSDLVSKWYEKGYSGELLAVSAFNETLGELIEYSVNNIEKGLDYYKIYRGEGLDLEFNIKGSKYHIKVEVKNTNSNNYLTTGWFMKEHELRFPTNKYGGDKHILIITAQLSKATKKWLKSKGIEIWQLSEQINKDNFDRMKSELITKYIRPLLFRIKSIITKYYSSSIVSNIVSLINTSIRHTYMINNRIDNIKLNNIELNKQIDRHGLNGNGGFAGLNNETARLKAKWLEEKAGGFSATVRLPNGCLVWA